jgi:hypothetical protein
MDKLLLQLLLLPKLLSSVATSKTKTTPCQIARRLGPKHESFSVHQISVKFFLSLTRANAVDAFHQPTKVSAQLKKHQPHQKIENINTYNLT